MRGVMDADSPPRAACAASERDGASEVGSAAVEAARGRLAMLPGS
jgi:hypothetical protein